MPVQESTRTGDGVTFSHCLVVLLGSDEHRVHVTSSEQENYLQDLKPGPSTLSHIGPPPGHWQLPLPQPARAAILLFAVFVTLRQTAIT